MTVSNDLQLFSLVGSEFTIYLFRGVLAAWLPDICQVGRLVRRPGGPLRQMLKYRSIDLGLPRYQKRVWREGREGSEGQSHKKEERDRECVKGRSQGPLAKEGAGALFGLY